MLCGKKLHQATPEETGVTRLIDHRCWRCETRKWSDKIERARRELGPRRASPACEIALPAPGTVICRNRRDEAGKDGANRVQFNQANDAGQYAIHPGCGPDAPCRKDILHIDAKVHGLRDGLGRCRLRHEESVNAGGRDQEDADASPAAAIQSSRMSSAVSSPDSRRHFRWSRNRWILKLKVGFRRRRIAIVLVPGKPAGAAVVPIRSAEEQGRCELNFRCDWRPAWTAARQRSPLAASRWRDGPSHRRSEHQGA